MILCPVCGSPPKVADGPWGGSGSGICPCSRLVAWDGHLRFLCDGPNLWYRLEAGPDGVWMEDGTGPSGRTCPDEVRVREVVLEIRGESLAREVLGS